MEKEKVEKAIKALKNIDATHEDASTIAKQIFLSIGKLHVLIDVMYSDTKVCRTRTHFNHVLFTDFKEITTPQSHHVEKYGRCNKPHSPIFYCSEDRKTSYSELVHDWLKNCPDGSFIYATINTWYTRRDMNLVIVASPDIGKRVSDFDKYYGNILDNEIAKSDAKEREAFIMYHRFLYDMFSKPSKDNINTYIITSAYCDLALEYAKDKADGILYPSVPLHGQGLNYALRPEFITPSNIELRTIFRDKLRKVNNPSDIPDFTEVEIIEAIRDFSNGEIKWCSYANMKLQV